MTASRKPRGKKWVALVGLLLALFGMAAFTVWKANPTINFLGFVALGGVLLLQGVIIRSGRRAAGAGGERPRGSEVAKLSTRGYRTIGIGLVLVGLVLVAVSFLSGFWVLVAIAYPEAMIGVLSIRRSFDRAPSPGTESGGAATPKLIRLFDRFMLGVGIALVPLMVFSALVLFQSGATGYHEVWPFHAFVAVGLVSLLVWPYLIGRAYTRWLTR